MLLENKYYKVLRARKESDGKAVYHVAILPDCNVYQGHFPGNPVCPGVCNIQTIKECASLLVGKELRISTIKQCLLTAIASPAICPEVDVQVEVTETGGKYSIVASIYDAKQQFMTFKGEGV
ncbi:MAG: beta-hydroxyacyl-ACP dehydratase [Bacteroidaceae bacterium]|jgi:3-hydroxyacyl-[acyl-carrier-protein] dehydratase|nr:beta-hydroxyacyl-ACP dehydratase [Bacteroidaceae bacterium]